MKFSIAVPTGEDGVYAPPHFAGPDQFVQLAKMAEKMGFEAVWTIDFTTPSPSMGIKDMEPPHWYESLITLAYLAAETSRIKLGTGVLILPNREPVLLAKQMATLDVISKGRAILGVGNGKYIDEFKMLHPQLKKFHRATMLEEGLEAQRCLLTDHKASFKGKYYEFANISIYPKPLQKPFPIYLGGVHVDSARRVAEWCTGWIMSVSTTLETLEERINRLKPLLEERGRNISEIDLAVVAVHSIAKNHDMAVKKFKNSRVVKRSAGQDMNDFVQRNLIGSPREIADKVKDLEQKGITHIFISNHANENFEDLLEQVQMLGEEVLPQFRPNQGL